VKDDCNSELVTFMQDTFGLDLLSDLKEGTTRCNSCTDMLFGRNVGRLTCMNCETYFSYHRPILSATSQATQITEVVPE
jgi:predicted adenine nucleotide alpha hydrolase (AANH) superfamily ATPase